GSEPPARTDFFQQTQTPQTRLRLPTPTPTPTRSLACDYRRVAAVLLVTWTVIALSFHADCEPMGIRGQTGLVPTLSIDLESRETAQNLREALRRTASSQRKIGCRRWPAAARNPNITQQLLQGT